jgi:hypothetical protein
MKLFTLSIICFASITLAEDFKTVDGQEYKNATLSRVEPDGIVLVTSSGISKVYFTELPKDVQDHFHYDAAQATAYTANQNAQVESVRKQREEARQKEANEIEKQAQIKRQKQAEMERQQTKKEERDAAPGQRLSESTPSRPKEADRLYELTQDHTIQIRIGLNGASIRLRRGERYHGRILGDHAEIDINGISYWLPSGILVPARD